MTRNIIRKTHTLRVRVQLFGVFIVLVALAALGQMAGTNHLTGKSHVVPLSGIARMRLEAKLLGPGAPLFLPAVTYDSGGHFAASVAVADVNGDGKPDALVANQSSNTIGVLLGNGDGTFQAAVTFSSGGVGPASVAVADVNGDGKPDALVANQSSNTVGVLLGNGDGTFRPAVAYNSGASGAGSVAVADVNGDGKLDLLVAHIVGVTGTCNGGCIGILLGNGDGTFQSAVTYSSGAFQARFVAVADVNSDGKADLVVTNRCRGQC
jgi:FG-GAP-like repeat/FG-GAP repeat